MAGRAKENFPRGSLKYLFVYLKVRIFKCSYRVCIYIHTIYTVSREYFTLKVWELSSVSGEQAMHKVHIKILCVMLLSQVPDRICIQVQEEFQSFYHSFLFFG